MLMSKEYSPLHTIMPNVNIVLILLFVIRHNSQNCGSGNMANKRLKECKICGEQFELHKKSNKCKSCGGRLRIVVGNRNIRKLGDV